MARVFRHDKDTDVENTVTIRPSNPFVVAPGDSLEFVINSNTDNTVANVNFWGTELQNP